MTAGRTCLKCDQWKEASEFHKKARGKFGLDSRCKECYRAQQIANRYGITVEEHTALSIRQGGVCAICREPEGSTAFAVDHCHETGRVRGLLCYTCNIGLGYFRDNTELLKGAIDYLNE